MATHDKEQIIADRKTADSGRCPECFTDLARLNVMSHARHCLPHGEDFDKRGSDHARRFRLLEAVAQSRTAKE